MAEVLTQGLSAYTINTEGNTVTNMGCLFDMDKISAPRGEIDTTGLCNTTSKTSTLSLPEPGEVTWTLMIDNENSDPFYKAISLFRTGGERVFAIGLSGSTVAPTVSGGAITWPPGRTFIHWPGQVKDASILTEKDGLVTVEMVIKMNGIYTVVSN